MHGKRPLHSPQRWNEVAHRLAVLGYSKQDLEKLIGGNMRRALMQILR